MSKLIAGKVLTENRPNQPDLIHAWDRDTIKHFEFGYAEVERLEEDKVLWRGSVAFELIDKSDLE